MPADIQAKAVTSGSIQYAVQNFFEPQKAHKGTKENMVNSLWLCVSFAVLCGKKKIENSA